MAAYPPGFGSTVSPILYLMYLRITNEQDVPLKLDSISIAAAKESTGPFEKLVSFNMKAIDIVTVGARTPSRKTLLLANAYLRLGTPYPFVELKFSAFAVAKPTMQEQLAFAIPAHEAVNGWVALDSLRHVGLTPGDIYFKVTTTDSAGKTESHIVKLPSGGLGDPTLDSDAGSLLFTGIPVDLSGAEIRYFSDSKLVPRQ